jgi:glutamate carboxypeptidase
MTFGPALPDGDGRPTGGREAACLLAAAASAEQEWAEALLSDLVSTESHATQIDGVNAVGARVGAALAEAGFETRRAPPRLSSELPDWLTDVMLPDGGRYAVGDVWVAERPGQGGTALLLGDLDTAFPPGALDRFPYQQSGTHARGPGVADMKGGLVVLTLAARLLARTGLATPTLRVVLSPDEQAGSLASRDTIREQAGGSDFCLTFECAREGGNLMEARAAVGLAQIIVHGREAHAGTSRDRGLSAIAGLAGMVAPIEALSDVPGGRLLTVTLVRGGWRRSLVPGECSCVVDLRAKDGAIWHATESELHRVVTAACRPTGLRATFRVAQHRPAVTAGCKVAPLKNIASFAGSLLGLEFGFVSSFAAGSSAFASAVPVLDGMGPPGADLMTTDEHIELSGLTQRAALVALVLHLSALPDVRGRANTEPTERKAG